MVTLDWSRHTFSASSWLWTKWKGAYSILVFVWTKWTSAHTGTTDEHRTGTTDEPITAYLERLQAYLDANEVAEGKRTSVLVSTIGYKTYGVLRSLIAPNTPQSKSYDNLVQALKIHYQLKRMIIAERYMFNQRCQHLGESVADYVAEL